MHLENCVVQHVLVGFFPPFAIFVFGYTFEKITMNMFSFYHVS